MLCIITYFSFNVRLGYAEIEIQDAHLCELYPSFSYLKGSQTKIKHENERKGCTYPFLPSHIVSHSLALLHSSFGVFSFVLLAHNTSRYPEWSRSSRAHALHFASSFYLSAVLLHAPCIHACLLHVGFCAVPLLTYTCTSTCRTMSYVCILFFYLLPFYYILLCHVTQSTQ
mmetsp:Transcript_42921/g.110803  ORF Transcript_42921/g.110803 Transcript_42921/m.110803 type:complete len:171 (+) Transcript_42921:956-1468(+)